MVDFKKPKTCRFFGVLWPRKIVLPIISKRFSSEALRERTFLRKYFFFIPVVRSTLSPRKSADRKTNRRVNV